MSDELEPRETHPEQGPRDHTHGLWGGSRYAPMAHYAPYVEEPCPAPPEPTPKPTLGFWATQKLLTRVLWRARRDGWIWRRKRNLFVNERTQQAESRDTILTWYYREGDSM
jgi:hypothetical protein